MGFSRASKNIAIAAARKMKAGITKVKQIVGKPQEDPNMIEQKSSLYSWKMKNKK